MQDTTLAAYESVQPALNTLQRKVLAKLSLRPAGMTDEELTDALGAENRSTFRTRRSELVKLGLVKATGQKRPMRSGRLSNVWAIVA